ncbi:MAG: leucine-rich repeat protein [Bacillota bacterium]|nr:leucine-rich repeat protein [Bacillota bacterium]
MKKIIPIFLAFTLIILQINTTKAFADTQSGDYNYTVSADSTAEITRYTGSDANVVIPSTIDGHKVTSIGYEAFFCCSSLSITIPTGVTNIGDMAFDSCGSLTKMTIPSGVTKIGVHAFEACDGLTTVTMPSSVTSIGNEAFAGCNSLTSITIPSGVTSIGNGAFQNCSKLAQIYVNTANTIYSSSSDGILYNKLKTTLVKYPEGKTASTFVIPSSVTSIGDDAFFCTSLVGITIPSSVTKIGNEAFDGCSNLSTIAIPSNVTSIGNGAFKYCTSFSSITIPSKVTTIGDDAFSGCSNLISITLPNSVTSIGSEAFQHCSNLTSIIIPSKVTKISDYMFDCCTNLSSITIPNSVTSIGDWAFDDCSSLSSIIIPRGVTSIGDWTFCSCGSLSSITIPSSVTKIGSNAFACCPSTLLIYYHNTAIGFTNPWNDFTTVAGNVITYYGNGSTSGTLPVDNNIYIKGAQAPILNNTGSIAKTGYTFAGWNTKADGSGTNYSAGSVISMTGTDLTLYAHWKAQTITTSISPVSGTFTKTSPSNLTAVITAPNKATNPVAGIYNGTTRLIYGTDQSIVSTTTGYTLTIYSSYLSKLTSNTPITIKFKDGSSLTYTVALGTTISPASGTFTKTAPANLTAVITAPNKANNPVTGVYNGTTRLVYGTDQSIVSTTTGYNLSIYSSYLSKLTSTSVITLKFKDGTSLKYTVYVK